jgi:hypothetical protein
MKTTLTFLPSDSHGSQMLFDQETTYDAFWLMITHIDANGVGAIWRDHFVNKRDRVGV